MRRITPYNPYQENINMLANTSCLISGNCPIVRSKVATQFIDNSFSSDRTMIIVDFCHDEYMDRAFHSSPYQLTMFDIDSSTGYDFFYNDGNINSLIRAVKHKAESLGYKHEETVQILKYMELLKELGFSMSDIRSLTSQYYDINQVNAELEKLVSSRVIHQSEIPRVISMLQRSAKGNILLESILTEQDFNLNAVNGKAFSIKQLPQRSLAHLRVNSKYNNATQAMIEALTKDIADCVKPISLIINAGKVSAADMLFNLVEMLTTHNYNLLFISDDIFADTMNHEKFRKHFDMNCFGAHSGESNNIISSSFGTRRIMEEHYSRNTDHRLTQNNVMDILFRSNYSEGVNYVPTELPVFRADYISSMAENEVITVFTKTNQVRVMGF